MAECSHDVLASTYMYDDIWYSNNIRSASYNIELNCERPDFYICEEPEYTVPIESAKLCDYRNVRYPEQIYRWVAGRGCLFFTPAFLYVGGANPINLNNHCFYGQLPAPCMEVAREDGTCACYPFDPGLEVVARAVREAMVPTPTAQERWERCFYSAAKCCSEIMLQNYSYSDSSYCKATFDAWTCWETVASGTRAQEICPEFAYSNAGPTCHHFSSKTCFENGTWELQTDYSTCSIAPRLLGRYTFHIIILAVSIACCLPAVFVFFFYKRLRVDRVILHRNLLIAVILRNVFVIVSRSTIYIDEITNEGDTIMSKNSVWCRIVSVIERFAGNAVFVCMLVEGIYLHRLIVAVFKKKLNINVLYGIGAAIAIIPVIVWSIVMALLNDHNCWVYYNIDHIQWALDAPRLCILIVNTALFLDILRVLLTKIRNSENVNQLSTTKATLFLMPIFGTQFLLTAFRPNTTSCVAEEAYFYITYTLEALQGVIVAMLYCYFNKEVRALVKITYKKTESAVKSRVRGDKNYRRATGLGIDRRITLSTAVPNPEDLEESIDEYAKISHKSTAEIVPVQTELFAEILEPVYDIIETRNIDNKVIDRQYIDYSKSSSIADAKDWIRCISEPTSSVYNNSLNDYEINYLQRNFPNELPKHIDPNEITRLDDNKVTVNVINEKDLADVDNNLKIGENEYKSENYEDNSSKIDMFEENNKRASNIDSDRESDNDMISEILQYFKPCDVILDPSILSPNRNDGDDIVFID